MRFIAAVVLMVAQPAFAAAPHQAMLDHLETWGLDLEVTAERERRAVALLKNLNRVPLMGMSWYQLPLHLQFGLVVDDEINHLVSAINLRVSFLPNGPIDDLSASERAVLAPIVTELGAHLDEAARGRLHSGLHIIARATHRLDDRAVDALHWGETEATRRLIDQLFATTSPYQWRLNLFNLVTFLIQRPFLHRDVVLDPSRPHQPAALNLWTHFMAAADRDFWLGVHEKLVRNGLNLSAYDPSLVGLFRAAESMRPNSKVDLCSDLLSVELQVRHRTSD